MVLCKIFLHRFRLVLMLLQHNYWCFHRSGQARLCCPTMYTLEQRMWLAEFGPAFEEAVLEHEVLPFFRETVRCMVLFLA